MITILTGIGIGVAIGAALAVGVCIICFIVGMFTR